MVDLVDSCELKHERNDNNWLAKADDKISVSYCFASDSAAAYNSSSSEADSKTEGNRIPNVMATEFIANETFLDLGASCIHDSEKCVDSLNLILFFVGQRRRN